MKRFKDWNKVAKVAFITGGIGAGFFTVKKIVSLVTREIDRRADAKVKRKDRQDELEKKKEFEDYKTQKRKEDVDYVYEKRREEEERKRTEDEQKDPEVKLKKQDQEVKAFVFRKLGLDQTGTPEGKCVNASEEAVGKPYSRSLLVGRIVSKGDTCVIVSQPGVGKSVLAFQMADDIAAGKASRLFSDTVEQQQAPQLVYYWDAEMDSDDMKERYPEGLSCNLMRFSNCNYRDGFYLLKHIIEVVSHLTADATIVLDNWKALSAKLNAYYFLTGLRKLQSMFAERGARLTVIIVIHTTKEACKKYEVDLGDVAGAAEITRFAKTVLFVNPIDKSDDVVQLHDAKRRTAKKKDDTLLLLKGGEGASENLHFEAIANESFEEMKRGDKPDSEEKKPGRKSQFTDEDDREIARRLDGGESAEDLAKEYNVAPKTIYDRAKRFRSRNN